MHATLGMNGRSLAPANLIRAVQDAEWYTGARSGLADQGAMILGALETLVNVVLHGDEPDLETMTTYAFPEELRVLVAHSHTERSLSGAQAVDYTRNRFAYSIALDIAQQEMRARGWPEKVASQSSSLAAFSPERLQPAGGLRALYDLLQRIPEECTLDDLRSRYSLPNLDSAYEQYFAGVSEDRRPHTIRLRGPLIFGIAESERARQFPLLLKDGAYAAAGAIMSTGHNGDRVRYENGVIPFHAGDTQLEKLAREEVDIAACPGEYGASSPVLDVLVDAAKGAGALGACLTGAGIAGSVLALCFAEDAETVQTAMAECLASQEYAALAQWDRPLSQEEARCSVVANQATGAAGELRLAV
jgi:galactokinase